MSHLLNPLMLPLILMCSCIWTSDAVASNEAIPLSDFANQKSAPWSLHHFSGKTDYQIKQRPTGEWALQASSAGAASAFYRKIEIDLEKTPILSWSWQVQTPLLGIDETIKAGDDYAARVYVVHKRGLLDKGIAINYIWSSGHQKSSVWPNAFARNSSKMLALQDRNTPLGQWQNERRNVRDDFKKLLGMDVKTVQLVVLMTDTDNSGLTAEATYGDLHFSAN